MVTFCLVLVSTSPRDVEVRFWDDLRRLLERLSVLWLDSWVDLGGKRLKLCRN